MNETAFSYITSDGHKDGSVILKLTGPLTLSTLFGFQNELRALRPPVLIIDLSDSPYMDSAGLGLIMNEYVSAEANGRRLLVAAVSERILALLQLTRVDTILKLFPSVEAAEASLA